VTISALQKVAVQVLSIIVSPAYGDVYSFPWKRGPQDNFNEYLEASTIFDQCRSIAYQNLFDFDFLSKLNLVL
jgi:hypothetical protein